MLTFRFARTIGLIGLCLLALPSFAHAAAGHVSGWGTRTGFTFGGDVHIAGDASLSGHVTILQDLPDGTHQSCRYTRLYRGSVNGNRALFHGSGVCHGPSG